MRISSIFRLVFAVAVCQMAGVVGSVFTSPSIPVWYASLQKPFFTPPSWIFAPVWVTLFFLMGVSAYLVWERGMDKKEVRAALFVFGIQLALNALWSFLFFGLQSPFYAFMEIVVLWIAIAVTILKFYSISRKAGFLLLPYIFWVSLAMALNFYIWALNP